MKKSNDSSSQGTMLWHVAEVKISYRNKRPIKELPFIKSSESAEKILRDNWSNDMELLEEFNALLLNKANYVKGFYRVSRGGVCGTVVDPKIIFVTALKVLASSIIIAHNHPSGCLKPSNPDIELTKKLKQAGQFLDIQVIDHIILSPVRGYFSFSDEGLI
ncbi:MAG: JAB domain-containing protein [Saprospiraceae bacterium]|nr:JAB domain-containing protein [Saprospiraceae bacterium]